MTFLCIHGIIIGAGESCIRCGYSPMGAMGSPQDGPVGRGEGRGVRLPAASTKLIDDLRRMYGTDPDKGGFPEDA